MQQQEQHQLSGQFNGETSKINDRNTICVKVKSPRYKGTGKLINLLLIT